MAYLHGLAREAKGFTAGAMMSAHTVYVLLDPQCPHCSHLWESSLPLQTKVKFETILMPLRHNGSTHTRILGAMTAIEEPYWLGVQPVLEQRITGLRLIWPDDVPVEESVREVATSVGNDVAFAHADVSMAMPTTVYGRSARRYAHLAVIDGGRN